MGAVQRRAERASPCARAERASTISAAHRLRPSAIHPCSVTHTSVKKILGELSFFWRRRGSKIICRLRGGNFRYPSQNTLPRNHEPLPRCAPARAPGTHDALLTRVRRAGRLSAHALPSHPLPQTDAPTPFLLCTRLNTPLTPLLSPRSPPPPPPSVCSHRCLLRRLRRRLLRRLCPRAVPRRHPRRRHPDVRGDPRHP